MSLSAEKSFRMKMRDVETAFKYRRFPYPKRSVELIALLAISCTFFLFMHTNKLNSRLKEMEMKLQPSEFSALGLTGSNHLDAPKREDINTLHGTYQYLKSTGQLHTLQPSHLNNTVKAEKDWIFFNRLEKVGSQSMMYFLQELAKVNNFQALENRGDAYIRSVYTEEEELAICEELDDVKGAMTYSEHTNWINFSHYDLPKPIYINLIRHPIDRIMSAYYFKRRPDVYEYYKKKFNRSDYEESYFKTSFNDCVKQARRKECVFKTNSTYNADWRKSALRFCGNKPACRPFNSPVAAQIAKYNVENEYAVVGSWEDTNITLTVLEHYIPRFFKNATNIFYSNTKQFHKNGTPHKAELEPAVEAKLKRDFNNEIDFYYFCKQRLYKQYIAIKKNEMIKEFEGNKIFPFNILA